MCTIRIFEAFCSGISLFIWAGINDLSRHIYPTCYAINRLFKDYLAMVDLGRALPDGRPTGERQLSRKGVSQAQPEHGAGNFGFANYGHSHINQCHRLRLG